MVRSQQMESLEKGTCLAHLCRALRRLPNLQKLVLKDLGSEPFRTTDNLYDDKLARSLDPCHESSCQTLPSDHLGFLVRPESGFRHEVASPWNLAMLAWWAVGSPVRELAVESWAYLPLRSFVSTVQKPCELNQMFQNLTKLPLNMLIAFREPGFDDVLHVRSFEEGLVSKALSSANNLRCLYITTRIGDDYDEDNQTMTLFQVILGTCQFPKLKSLILVSLDSTMEELFKFLGASKQLQQLTLVDHELFSGSWEQAADWIRSTLTLEEVDIADVYGSCDVYGSWKKDSLMLDHVWGPSKGHFVRVQEFFLRHGPNPFSEEMLAARFGELEDARELTCDEAAEERYQRYH